jgi:hypothetical protein
MTPVIFTPDNEPYLGRKLLFHFDQMILALMETNSNVAPRTYSMHLNDYQKMAATVIPQAISISLSIRELIRQGYLFGAQVLERPLTERVVILEYLHLFPEEIEKWNRGWKHRDAPALAEMFDKILAMTKDYPNTHGYEVTKPMNSILHGKPDSSCWNMIEFGNGVFGLSPSKITNKPEQCDQLCASILPWLAVIQAMMTFYFPEEKNKDINLENLSS